MKVRRFARSPRRHAQARLPEFRAQALRATPGTRFSRRLGIDRRDDAFRRFDDLAGVEAQILAKARRQDLHAGAQATVYADRHGERGKSIPASLAMVLRLMPALLRRFISSVERVDLLTVTCLTQ